MFRGRLERDFRGTRVAWCPDLGGLPLDRARARRARRAAQDVRGPRLHRRGRRARISRDAERCSSRSARSARAATYGPLLDRNRDLLKPEAIAEIERGRALTTAAVAQAMVRHAQLLDRMRRFEESYEFMLCAVNQMPPFDASHRLAEGDRGRRDGALHRMAEVVLLDHGDASARDLGAGGLHARWLAGRHPDRRPLSRRLRRAQLGARLRASDARRACGGPLSESHSGASAELPRTRGSYLRIAPVLENGAFHLATCENAGLPPSCVTRRSPPACSSNAIG